MFVKEKVAFVTEKVASTVFKLAIGFASLWFATLSAQATSPTEFDVVGNTIIFNHGDWYQVQNAETFESLCEGNDPCTVPDGEYIVINHSLMERFPATVDGTNPDGGGFEVLTWPNDGWYQVQNAETFQSVCEGGSRCTVGPGQYVVINHTTGTREEVSVPSGFPIVGVDPYPAYSHFEINGRSITFTTPGWYQVLRQFNYEAVCESDEQCSVTTDGYHQVINFTSGERWTDVYIGDDLTRASCVRQGGEIIGDIGDGAIHRPEFRCDSGERPAFGILPLIGEPISFEGEVCCL